MKIAVISVGSEILAGRILNRDLLLIADFLRKFGLRVTREITVKDEVEEIVETLMNLKNFDIIFITGGLGPTSDDVTKKAIARFFNVDLESSEMVLKLIEERLKDLGVEFLPVHRNYALIPRGAKILRNDAGLAPGMVFSTDKGVLISLPGPPREVESLLPQLEGLLEKYKRGETYLKTVKTFGLRESEIYDRLKDCAWSEKAGFYPSIYGVDIRIETERKDELDEILIELKDKLGESIYGYDNETLEMAFGKVLKERDLTVSTAESCSGGLLANLITNVSGSSEYYIGGIIAYHNRIKVDFLGISQDVLKKYGAVSEPTARQMAEGIRKLFDTDVGLSTTGIAGPTGGTPQKPVGLVYMGFSFRGEVHVIKKIFKGNRFEIKKQTAYAIMDFARRYLLKKL